MRAIICIQARMTSSRLPGKVLMPLAHAPLLERMIERVQAARVGAKIVVITSRDRADDPIASLCRRLGIECFRGHRTDLLDRHYQAAKHYEATIVAKIPSDCPLIDPSVIENVFRAFYEHPCDYASNLHPASYPDGNDVEVFTFDALEQAWNEATQDFEREHTTPFLWERPDRFTIVNRAWESGFQYSMTHRWTIDYPEDFEFIRTVYDYLWKPERPVFSMNDILVLLSEHPEIEKINATYRGVNWYRNHLDALHTIGSNETRTLQDELT